MSMLFYIDWSQPPSPIALRYIESEYSFFTHSHPGACATIALRTLQLVATETGEIVSLWGYCPYTGWKTTTAQLPDSSPGRITAQPESDFIPGTGISLGDDADWPCRINPDRNVICIGSIDIVDGDVVEFATGCIAVIKKNQLKAVWITCPGLPTEYPYTY